MAATEAEVTAWRANRITASAGTPMLRGPDPAKPCSGCGLSLGEGPLLSIGWLNPFASPEGAWFHDHPDCVPEDPMPVVRAGRGPIVYNGSEWSRG